MAAIGDEKPSLHRDAKGLEPLLFLDQGQGIENDARTDNASYARMKNAGGNQVQDVPAIPDADRMPGVVTALVSRYAVEILRQNINDLSFTFVAPLCADDGDVLLHGKDGPGSLNSPDSVGRVIFCTGASDSYG